MRPPSGLGNIGSRANGAERHLLVKRKSTQVSHNMVFLVATFPFCIPSRNSNLSTCHMCTQTRFPWALANTSALTYR